MPVLKQATASEIAQRLREVADRIEQADDLIEAEVVVLPDTEPAPRALDRMIDAPGRQTLAAVVVWREEPA